ncbi:MAG: glycosyltransferase family 1 protein [Candidatus Hydrogenedentota bacterium]
MEYTLLLAPDQKPPEQCGSLRRYVLPWTYGDISRSDWLAESRRTGRFLNELNPDLYHAPDLYMPRGFTGPVVVTACDYFELPIVGPVRLFGQTYGWRWNFRFRFRYRWTWRTMISHAACVATISHTTAQRVRHRFPSLADRVVAVPLGLDETWFTPPSPRPDVLAKYGLDRPLILHVGGLEKRKNPQGVLNTFQRLRREMPTAHLALAGPLHGPKTESPGVHVLGFLPLDDLQRLYAAADCLLYPSFDEGFGLPVVEALAMGCPVVTSRGTATEEVAMGHASLVDPSNADEIYFAVLSILRSPRPMPAADLNRSVDTAKSYFSLYRECLRS